MSGDMDAIETSDEAQNDQDVSEDRESHKKDEDFKAELLENPIKSVNDRRQFRTIRLSNGLTALLVSLPDDYEDLDNGDSEDDDYNSMDDEENDAAGKLAREKYRKENEAVCGLTIDVGRISDPEDIPGMTLVLAEMVSTGSGKYPQNTIENYADKCGASFSNFSGYDQTHFNIYAIPQSLLRETLDRLAHCFIDPLLSCDSIPGARSIIQFDGICDVDPLYRIFAQSDKSTLKWIPHRRVVPDEVTNEQLREELIKFRKRHYSAHRMTLSIEAKLPLDTLEKYAKECFSNIPSNGLPPDDFSDFKGVEHFDTAAFRRMYKMTMLITDNNVELRWIMPSQLRNYRTKPYEYPAWILRQKGEGSLYRYLEKKQWCKSIHAGSGNRGFEMNTLYTVFKLALDLTKKGLENLKEVLDAVFSYINMMRAEEPRKEIFDDIQKIQEKRFMVSRDEGTTFLSKKMQSYPPVDYLTGDALCFEYDPVSIKACLNVLRPEKVNIIEFTKLSFHEIIRKYDSLIQREGTGIEISDDWIRVWKTAEPMPEFKLPEPNVFVADKFDMIPTSVDANRYPVKIHEDSRLEVWYKADKNLGFCESFMNLQYVSPLPSASSKNMTMQHLFVRILRESLSVRLKTATAADLSFDVFDYYKGFWVEVRGFYRKLPLLLETVASHVAQASNLVTEDSFRDEKEKLLKHYSRAFMEPEEFSMILVHSIKNVINWTPVGLYEALSDVEFSEFRDFVERLIRPIYVRSFVQGNVTEIDAIRSVQRCVEISNCQPAQFVNFPTLSEVVIARGVRCCRVKSFDPHNYKSNVTNYYQFNVPSPNVKVMISVLIMILKHDLWNTVYGEQLIRGFDLNYYGIIDSCATGYGYFITGYSHDEDTVEDVDSRIEIFREYFNKIFREMSADDLLGIKEDLIKIRAKHRPVVGSKEDMDANWQEIVSEAYSFDREERVLEILKELPVEEFRIWMTILSAADSISDMRKLTAQVVGFDEVWEDCPDQVRSAKRLKSDLSNAHTLRYSLEYLTGITDERQRRDNDYYIKNIEHYKQGLATMPL